MSDKEYHTDPVDNSDSETDVHEENDIDLIGEINDIAFNANDANNSGPAEEIDSEPDLHVNKDNDLELTGESNNLDFNADDANNSELNEEILITESCEIDPDNAVIAEAPQKYRNNEGGGDDASTPEVTGEIPETTRLDTDIDGVKNSESSEDDNPQTISQDDASSTTHSKPTDEIPGNIDHDANTSVGSVYHDALQDYSSVGRLLKTSNEIDIGKIKIYEMDSQLVLDDPVTKIRRYEILPRRQSHLPRNEKVVMLLGGTGSGKSTLINGLVNYVLGVKWSDSYRFKLIKESTFKTQDRSQTTWITSYTINHQDDLTIPYTLTLIDTPGFGDTSGIKRDQEIINQIREFFTGKGIDKLDAIGFVVQSALPRLTPAQRYIFDQVLSLFGKDIEDNIMMLLTFADGNEPQVLPAIKAANIPYKKYFKFNNSALYISNHHSKHDSSDSESESDDEGDESFDFFHSMFWKMGAVSFKSLIKGIAKMESKSLTLTRDVLHERRNLEVYLDGLQKDMRLGTNKLEQLAIELMVLQDREADVDRNRNFTYTVIEERIETDKLPKGAHVTNCNLCNVTCHYPCYIEKYANKSGCAAMRNGYCTICESKCCWDKHRNMPYRYVIHRESVTKTLADIKRRYDIAEGERVSAKNLVGQVHGDFENVQIQLLDICGKVRDIIARLDEIALKPNPLSIVDYLDLLIKSEEASNQPGHLDRLQQLRCLRVKAVTVNEIKSGKYDPFRAYEENIEKEVGIWGHMKRFYKNTFQKKKSK